MLGEVLTIIAPVFLCAAVGWGWVQAGRRYDNAILTDLIFYIGAPCLVFSGLVGLDAEPADMGLIAFASLVSTLAHWALGALLLRPWQLPAHTYLPPLMFGNSGNMGLPLCLFAFGPQGLALAVSWFTVAALSRFTVGVWITAGSLSFRELVRTPMTHAAVYATVVIAAGLEVPTWLGNTVDLLGRFTIPLMLLTLGASLSQLHLSHVPRTLALAALRLALGVGLGVAVAAALDLSGVARGVVVLQSSAPAAVFNYLFAQQYDRAPEEVASIVVLSTLLSILVIPLVLIYLV
jgi:predicted permease